MICIKCGAVGVGRYCFNCGTKLKTATEQYRFYQRKAAKEFKNECLQYRIPGCRDLAIDHLSTACWLASDARYGIESKLGPGYTFAQADIDNLGTVRDHAMLLFRQLLCF